MNNLTYTVRNYRPADLEAFIRYIIEAARVEPDGRPVRPELIAERLQRPGFEPEKDLFIAETGREIIGHLEVMPELASRRVIFHGWIHPAHRRRGLATRLFELARQRAPELKAKTIRIDLPNDHNEAAPFLLRLGFRPAREYLQLELDTADVPSQETPTANCRPLQPGEAALFNELQNCCFAGAWEFNPNTTEETARSIDSPFSSPADIILICDGDRAIGYCRTMTFPAETGQPTRGHILMLGIHPDYRGRGLGRAAILAGITHLASKGAETIELTVDSQNQTARSLYDSLGFKVRGGNVWYEQTLD